MVRQPSEMVSDELMVVEAMAVLAIHVVTTIVLRLRRTMALAVHAAIPPALVLIAVPAVVATVPSAVLALAAQVAAVVAPSEEVAVAHALVVAAVALADKR